MYGELFYQKMSTKMKRVFIIAALLYFTIFFSDFYCNHCHIVYLRSVATPICDASV